MLGCGAVIMVFVLVLAAMAAGLMQMRPTGPFCLILLVALLMQPIRWQYRRLVKRAGVLKRRG